jgi:UDP-N-acetylmuramate dehydrogenase
VPLRQYSTLKVGGPAWALAEPQSRQELIEIAASARDHDIPAWVIGAGSSVIPDDRGFHGLIICTRKVKSDPAQVSPGIIEADCGVMLPKLARICQELGLSGLEWSIGIPGTVGGAIWMNAGASGTDMSALAEEISFWDGSQVRTVQGEDVHWGGRYSSFQDHPERVILGARLRLRQSSREFVEQAFKERLEIIKETQPRSNPSVGTVFRANRKALPTLAAGLREGAMICCQGNPAWINNLGGGTASDAYRLVRRVMRRHLWRGLPMPKIEPVFLPCDPRSEVSPTLLFNHPPVVVRFMAKVSRCWRFLFRRHLATWKPHV